MAPITTVTPQMPAAEPTDLGVTEADWSLTSGGGVNHDGARKVPARISAELRAMARRYGFSTDVAGANTHEGRLLSLEAGSGATRTETMAALPAFCDRGLTMPDAYTTDHDYDLSVASGRLRITPTSGTSDSNLRRAYGHIPSGMLGDSEVRSTFYGTSVNMDSVGRFQFGHVHRMRVDRVTLDSGIATAGASTTLTDSTKSWATSPRQFAGKPQGGRQVFLKLVAGTGAPVAQIRKVINNTGTVLTVDTAWSVNPDTTTYYEVYTYAVNCISVLEPIVFGVHAGIQPTLWDNGTYSTSALAGVSMTAYLGNAGSMVPLPWKMKSRVRGNTLDAALWAASDAEPTYGTAGKSGSWTIPEGFGDTPGMSGLYAGHMVSGDWLEYDDLTITKL